METHSAAHKIVANNRSTLDSILTDDRAAEDGCMVKTCNCNEAFVSGTNPSADYFTLTRFYFFEFVQ
jgi:hypothetical protein